MDNSDFSLYESDDEYNEFLNQRHFHNVHTTAFPKLTFMSAPRVCPVLRDISSVAKLRSNNQKKNHFQNIYRSKRNHCNAIHAKHNSGIDFGSANSYTLHSQELSTSVS